MKSRWAPVLAVVASGAMAFASTGVNHVWPLAWLAPLPLLVVLPDLGLAGAALASLAAAALGASNLVLAYRDLPPVVLGLAVTLTSLQFMGIALAWRAIARRARPPRPIIAVVAYAALVTAVEYLVSLVSPHGTFGSLGYSQADVPAVVQIASVTGLWGISFLVSIVPAALAVAWRGRRERRTVVTALAAGAVPLVLALVFGAVRLALPAPPEQVRVGLAASDGSIRFFESEDPAEALAVIRAYADRAAALAERGAAVVVLPEKFVSVTPAYAESARAVLAQVARDHRVTIVAGFNDVGGGEPRNLAVVFGPDGRIPLEYDKIHPVPGLEEGYLRGRAIGLLPRSAGVSPPLGIAICKDLDFVPLGRAHARAGVGLLLVPAWDFVNDGWLHSRMAVLRAVEGGYALARTASDGLLTVSDARGRIVAERSSSAAPEVLLTADVPVGSGGTFYSRTGDWFAWLCILGIVGIVVFGRRINSSRSGIAPIP